jgi:Ca-activated chloride channel family protein
MLKQKLQGGAIALVLAVGLTGCVAISNDPAPIKYDSSPTTLNIVAGSEQKTVVSEIVEPWCKQQGLTCNVTFKGSVDQARLVQTNSNDVPYDAFWFASSIWRQLGDTNNRLQSVEPTSITPLVFAGWKPEMQKLGLTNDDVTVQQIAEIVESGKTSTWVTNPTQSNSGAMAYFAFLNGLAGNAPGAPLTEAQLKSPSVQSGIKKFVQSFDNTPPSTGTMMDACVEAPDRCRTMFTYEDLVIEYNQKLVASGKQPLYAVYPKGSLAIADSPLGFYPHGDNANKKANFLKLEQFLLSDKTQAKLLEYGRRPVKSIGLTLTNPPLDVFNPAWGIQTDIKEQSITFPSSNVIEEALSSYQTTLRRPADTVYCIDGSGSMSSNGGWDGVDKASGVLFDPKQSQQYLVQLNPADKTTVLIFNDGIKGGPWTVDGNNSKDLSDLKKKIDDQGPGGGTGIYNCLKQAAGQFGPASADRRQLIILMTDGQDTAGGKEDALKAVTNKDIPVIAIGFGSAADATTLGQIAKATNGTYIAAGNSVDDVAQALRSATAFK